MRPSRTRTSPAATVAWHGAAWGVLVFLLALPFGILGHRYHLGAGLVATECITVATADDSCEPSPGFVAVPFVLAFAPIVTPPATSACPVSGSDLHPPDPPASVVLAERGPPSVDAQL
jgi:hypothetical protein